MSKPISMYKVVNTTTNATQRENLSLGEALDLYDSLGGHAAGMKVIAM
jgi:hypothetical protein